MRKIRKKAAFALLSAAVLLCGCTPIDEVSPVAVTTTPAVTVSPVSTSAAVTSSVSTSAVSKEPETEISSVSDIPAAAGITDLPVSETTKEIIPRVPDTESFHKRLEEICGENEVYGMGVALFRDGEIIYVDSLGYANIDTEEPVTEKTKFRAASVSKLISTIPVMMLVEQGLYDFDGDLSEQTGIPYASAWSGEVKLWHLLTHTAGITDTYIYDSLSPIWKYSTEYLMKDAHTGMKAGTVYNYSNFGAGTMGSIVERITGEYFHDYADKVLFRPLGMDAGYLIDFIKEPETCAYLYDYDGEIFNVPDWGRRKTYYESFGLGNSYLTAQCELLISARDLALLGTALAGDGTLNGYRLLSEQSIERIHTEYFQAEEFGMGLNVRIYDGSIVEGRTLYGHPGNALGAITGLYYDREDRTGVAVLTNHANQLQNNSNGVYKTLDDVITAAYEEFF